MTAIQSRSGEKSTLVTSLVRLTVVLRHHGVVMCMSAMTNTSWVRFFINEDAIMIMVGINQLNQTLTNLIKFKKYKYSPNHDFIQMNLI